MTMPTGYAHLSLEERDIMTTMLSEQRSLGEIAQALGRSKSTLPRELTRNSSPEYKLYLSHRAHGRAEGRRQHASRRRRLKNDRIAAYVTAQLQEGWSPEQIAGRIACDHPGHSTQPRGHLSVHLPSGHRRPAGFDTVPEKGAPETQDERQWSQRAHDEDTQPRAH